MEIEGGGKVNLRSRGTCLKSKAGSITKVILAWRDLDDSVTIDSYNVFLSEVLAIILCQDYSTLFLFDDRETSA